MGQGWGSNEILVLPQALQDFAWSAPMRERLERLRASGELLRQSVDLRALIGRVRDAVRAGSIEVDDAALRAWEEWASAEADRLDPILSGQIMTHLAQCDEGR